MELGFRNIHNFVSGILPDGLEWIAFSISGIFLALVVINALVGVAALYLSLIHISEPTRPY